MVTSSELSLTIFCLSNVTHVNYVEVWDGSPITSSLLGKSCSGNPDYVSTRQNMMVKFKTNLYKSGKGFQISYWKIYANDNKLSG